MALLAWLSFAILLAAGGWSMFWSSITDNSHGGILSIEACKEIAASVSSASALYDEGESSSSKLCISEHTGALQDLLNISKISVTGHHLVRRFLDVRLSQDRPQTSA